MKYTRYIKNKRVIGSSRSTMKLKHLKENKDKVVGSSSRFTMKYSKYLKNKRVVVVGSSSHLIAQKQGDFIDSHDVIVRIGNSSVLPEELEEDYGKKRDVIYTWHSLMRYNKIQEEKTESVKFIFMCRPRHKKADLPIIVFEDDENWLNDKKITYKVVAKKQKFDNNQSLHGGMFAFYDLLNSPIDSLYVTGFSFHRTSTVVVNQSGYEIESNIEFRSSFEKGGALKKGTLVFLANDTKRPRKRLTIASYNSDIDKYYISQLNEPFSMDELLYGHNPVKEETEFFKLAAKDERIKMDDYLQNLRR